jgi:hypothetical protein
MGLAQLTKNESAKKELADKAMAVSWNGLGQGAPDR